MELIKRKLELETEIDSEERVLQVSYNSDGRLALRFYSPDEFAGQPEKRESICKHCGEAIHSGDTVYPYWYHDANLNRLCEGDDGATAIPNEEIPMHKAEEMLIVLSKMESEMLISFVRNNIMDNNKYSGLHPLM